MLSKESRKKIGAASKKRWACPEYRKKMKGRKLRGYTNAHREKLRERFTGPNNPMWKGDNAGYHALHEWVSGRKGKASSCQACGSNKKVQWANKDHSYRRCLDDYVELCASCHNLFDRLFNDYGSGVIRRDNKSGCRGVSWDKRSNRWRAYMTFSGERVEKKFDSFDDAVAFRRELECNWLNEMKERFKTIFNF